MSNCYATPLTFGSNTLESADKAQSTIYMTLLNYSIQRRSPHGSIVRFKVSGVCWHQVFPEPGDIKIFVENRDSQFARHKEICFAVKYGFTALHFYSFKIMFFRNSLDVRNEKILWCITVPPLWTHGSLFLAPGRGKNAVSLAALLFLGEMNAGRGHGMKHRTVPFIFFVALPLSCPPTFNRWPNLACKLTEQAKDDRSRIVDVDWTYREKTKSCHTEKTTSQLITVLELHL